jgi:uncharacterized protein YbjT (DUF2867 family)
MIIVMGGTGNIGSAVVSTLRDRGEAVAIVTHAPANADRPDGVDVIEADVAEAASLRAAFRRGTRAFLLNPQADPSTDTDAVERRSAADIVAALDGSGLEKVVAVSTYGAQPGERLADLGVLWDFEQALAAQPIPAAIDRGAYYLTNWDAMIEPAREHGVLPAMLPEDLAIPMVAPGDLADVAVERLLSPIDDVGVVHVEGPERYTVTDVAHAFADALGRPVEPQITPREEWVATFKGLGFSDEAADSYARMTATTVDQGFTPAEDAIRGSITLRDHIAALVR